jgi:hypothetical protein
MPLVILHHFLNVSVQFANKRGFKKKVIHDSTLQIATSIACALPTAIHIV